jgi:PAS domain-containing protein
MKNEERNFTEAQILRMKAEELVRKGKITPRTAMVKDDGKRLLHELQVHQIELEMQNEELRQAYQVAEEALKNYTLVYDFAPMGYFILDRKGTICELNFTGAEILGDKRSSLLESNYKLFVKEGDRTKFTDYLGKIFKSKTKTSCTLELGYEEYDSKRVYIEGIATGEDEKCLLSVVDVTDFRKRMDI